MYLYLCNPLLKNGKLFKYFAESCLIYVIFLYTKSASSDNKFGRNKKASTFALPIKNG
jgi:hypothetical protein